MEETERLLNSLVLLDEKLEAFVALNGLGERDGSGRYGELIAIEKKINALLDVFEVEDPCANH
jgi:hypothetical protein